MRVTGAAATAILTILAAALQLRAQIPEPQATFRGGTDLVQIEVSVLDRKRHPARGLTASDFTVFEDGQPREIQAFSEVYLPDRLRAEGAEWMRQVPSDVATNQSAEQEGRLVIILLDRTIPVGEPTITARRVAAAAINQLGPADLAAVVSTSNGAAQNLTSDRSRLLRAISDSDLSTDISDEAKEIERAVFALTGREWSTLNDGRCQCGLCVLETITRVADAVQSTVRRRKLLLFIGSDVLLQVADAPNNPRNDIGCQKRVKDARDAMFTAVDRANLTVHSFDPSGLVNVNPSTKASSTARPGSGPFAAVALGSATADLLARQGNLQVLPDRTGGRAVMNTNGPDLAVPEIFHESDSYYLIGFRPANPAAGTFHRITVKTTRRGLDVHARSGYTQPAPVLATNSPGQRDTIGPTVRDALTALLPSSGTPVGLNASTFAIPGTRKGAIVLTLDVGALAAAPAAGAGDAQPLEIVATAIDQRGRAHAMARQALDLSWPASGRRPEQRFDALSRLDVAPGEYELRVAVASGARSASVFSYLAVPDFATVPLSLSTVVIAATTGTLTAPRDFLSPLLPLVPTTRREFARSDTFGAFFRIYQGTARVDPLLPVQLQSRLVDSRGSVVAAETSTLGAERFAKDRTAGHYLTVPLTALAGGNYLLQIEAKMGDRVAGRAVRFVVTQ